MQARPCNAEGLNYNWIFRGVGCLIDLNYSFLICCDTVWRACRQFPQIRNTNMHQRNGRRKKTTAREDRLHLKQKHAIARPNLAIFVLPGVEVEDTWRPWIFLRPSVTFVIMSLLLSHSYVASMRGQKLLNLLWIYTSFVLHNSLFSLAVVFFLRPFLYSIFGISYCGNCLQTFQIILQEMGNRMSIPRSIKTPPTVGWRNTDSCCILAPLSWARLHLTIFPPLKRKRICYSFILCKIVCHFPMVTSQRHHYTNKPIQLNIHVHLLLLMLQYLWPRRVL